MKWGLRCFERDGNESVPGCRGTGRSGKNYCYAPPTDELIVMGDNNVPAENFPLGKCQGDCDSDTDCAVSSRKKGGKEKTQNISFENETVL